ncbi:antitoxin VapB family protein [Halococcus salsus]|uniref:antitoxin VapB family protein n=1 Tax=Halococcus salsus TaxID=2162894 RepID=UPI00135C80E8|nr:antitoxin VapB family protein [Halococcus salsus]
MGTKTISLADDAYERLEAAKREGESFSDAVRRLTPGIHLAEYVGILDEGTADELDTTIAERRAERTDDRRARVRAVADALDERTAEHSSSE